MKVPFNIPPYLEESTEHVVEALKSGKVSGRGPYTERAERWLLDKVKNVEGILLTTSCTHALEVAAILLDLEPGDEVIVPSYTFVSSALAFLMHGATLRFCDVRADTANLDEKILEEHITKRTRAIVVVHYAGVSCEMDAIMAVAKKHNIYVIEDNAHGLFGKYKGVQLGCIGDFSTHSFHETKNISCGEGGALYLKSEQMARRAEIIIEKGTNRSQFINGLVDKYTWVDKGSSYVLSDILAALLYSQLEASQIIQEKRKVLWESYRDGLEEWAGINDIKLPFIPDHCEQTYHMFYMIMPTKEDRDAFIAFMRSKGVSTTSHYMPLHLSKKAQDLVSEEQLDCPVSKSISDRLVRLPLFFNLDISLQRDVIDVIISWRETFGAKL